jgi:hypothetical protein
MLYLIAAALSFLGAAAHEIVGAPMVLLPLADTELPQNVIWLHHFSWHVGTVAVVGMAALYIVAMRHPAGRLFALVATAMSTGFAAVGIGLASYGNSVLWTTPAPYPWTLVALVGLLGVLLTPKSE